MTVSTDAVLCWGFDLGDPNEWYNGPLVELPTPEELVAMGEYWYPGDSSYIKSHTDAFFHNDNWETLWRLRTGGKPGNFRHKSPVVYHRHCSGECPMYVVTHNTSVLTAWRGHPQVVQVDKLRVTSQWEQPMKDFCAVMGVKWEEPKWLLMSYWG